MPDPSIKLTDPAALDAILSGFRSHLTCWKVGLWYGSTVYLDLGELELEKVQRTKLFIGGSATLALEGYEWAAYAGGVELCRADTVTREFAETILASHFVGQRLIGITTDDGNRSALLTFTNNLRIDIAEYQDDPKFVDEQLFTLYLPDGRCVCYDLNRGLFIADGNAVL